MATARKDPPKPVKNQTEAELRATYQRGFARVAMRNRAARARVYEIAGDPGIPTRGLFREAADRDPAFLSAERTLAETYVPTGDETDAYESADTSPDVRAVLAIVVEPYLAAVAAYFGARDANPELAALYAEKEALYSVIASIDEANDDEVACRAASKELVRRGVKRRRVR